MTRERVFAALNFEVPPGERVPRQMWTLPWPDLAFPGERERIQAPYPDDICMSPTFLRTPSKKSGDAYAVGTYVNELEFVFDNKQTGVIGEVKQPLIEEWDDLRPFIFPKSGEPSELRTNDESIYALGDCAEAEGRVRLFVMPIMRGAQALAMTLKRVCLKRIATMGLLLVAVDFSYANELYVAVDGHDDAAGTEHAPLASLKGAQAKVRSMLAENKAQEIDVYFKEGTYRLNESVVFSPADSPEDGRVVYSAVAGERVVFSSGVPVKGWMRVARDEEPEGLPLVARGKLYSAEIPAGLGRIKTLYRGDKKLPRSQGKGFFPTEIEPRLNKGKKIQKSNLNTLSFPEGAARNWSNIEDIEIRIIPRYQFAMNILPVSMVDEKRNLLRTKIDGTYPLIKGYFSDSAQSASAWIENAPDGLDEPGEWMVDTQKGKIYYWPSAPQDLTGVVAPSLKEYIRFEGNEQTGELVKNIKLRGFVFTHGERDTWDEETAAIQHDYASYDRADALIRFRFAEKCAVQFCRFTNSGGTGVRCDLFSQEITIEDNQFDHLGSSAVLLAGFGPGTVDVNKNNRIVNNDIYEVGQEYWQSSAIMVYQSGNNYIAHNFIRDIPFNAIAVVGHRSPYFKKGKRSRETACMRFDEMGDVRTWPEIIRFLHGKENVIEYNEITRVGTKLGDVNAIYISSTGRNNHIRYNYLYDVQFRMYNAAIRSDDEQHDTYINHNVIDGCVGRGITLKGRNYVENNFIIDVPDAEDPRNVNDIAVQGYILLKRGPMDGSTIKKNILYHPGNEPLFFWTGPAFGRVTKLSDADTDKNLVYCAGDSGKSDKSLVWAKEEQGSQANGVATDPMFADLANHDYRLLPGSPALALGIEQIDVSKAGLTCTVGPEGLK